MGKRPRASSVSNSLMVKRLLEQRLQGHDIRGRQLRGSLEHAFVQLNRRERLVQPHPSTVPWLELRVRQMCLDLDHAPTKEIEEALVVSGRSLEVQPDLQAARAGVMPHLVVKIVVAVVDLHQPAPATQAVEPAEGWRQLRLEVLAQPGEEVRRR